MTAPGNHKKGHRDQIMSGKPGTLQEGIQLRLFPIVKVFADGISIY